jgi:hypothetical protein
MTLLEQIDQLIIEADTPSKLWDSLETKRLHFQISITDLKQEGRIINRLTKIGMELCGSHIDDDGTKILTWGCRKEELIKFKNFLIKAYQNN